MLFGTKKIRLTLALDAEGARDSQGPLVSTWLSHESGQFSRVEPSCSHWQSGYKCREANDTTVRYHLPFADFKGLFLALMFLLAGDPVITSPPKLVT